MCWITQYDQIHNKQIDARHNKHKRAQTVAYITL